ncbi:MAG TPA: VanZ family protein [Geobacteraceae bacterium]
MIFPCQGRLCRWLLAAGWAGTLCWLSLTPAPPVFHLHVLDWDKLQHAAAFAVLTLFLGSAMFPSADARCWWKAVLVAVCFGALIEILQGLFPSNRSAELADLVADLVGALAVWAVVAVRQRLTRTARG